LVCWLVGWLVSLVGLVSLVSWFGWLVWLGWLIWVGLVGLVYWFVGWLIWLVDRLIQAHVHIHFVCVICVIMRAECLKGNTVHVTMSRAICLSAETCLTMLVLYFNFSFYHIYWK
jgi:hypothetical protein